MTTPPSRSGRTAAEADLLELLHDLVARAVVPGGVAAVVGPAGPILTACFGRRALEPEPEPATLDTFWDCSSLTKPLVTAALWRRLRARGEADFGWPATRLIPELGTGPHRSPTIAELLVHSGGIPAWEPLYAVAPGGLPARAAWLGRHRDEPGRRAVYGCPGYQLLGLALERLTGRSLPDLARSQLWPGREDLQLPLPPELTSRAAPTERGNAREREMAGARARGWSGWRTELIRGQVHDVNAWSLGGAAGNAGLFATLPGLCFLAAGLLHDEDLDELSADQVAAAARGAQSERRSWGFQLARSVNSCAGPALSDRAFGHAGFTGTSLFVDPDRRAAYVLLTNRVHPRWSAHAFHEDRRRFHAAAARLAEAARG